MYQFPARPPLLGSHHSDGLVSTRCHVEGSKIEIVNLHGALHQQRGKGRQARGSPSTAPGASPAQSFPKQAPLCGSATDTLTLSLLCSVFFHSAFCFEVHCCAPTAVSSFLRAACLLEGEEVGRVTSGALRVTHTACPSRAQPACDLM